MHPNILQAVQDLGFVNCMPVQEQAIPHILYNDINLVALAQTGTGKTAAFGLPILNNIACSTENVAYKADDKKDMLHTTSSILHQTSALIIAPTRELCIQIANDCKKFAKYLPQIKIVPVYGGASIEQQIKELKKGADIIVATPGRLIDLLDRKKVKLGELKYLVLDEAD